MLIWTAKDKLFFSEQGWFKETVHTFNLAMLLNYLLLKYTFQELYTTNTGQTPGQ